MITERRIANWGIIRPFAKVGKLNKTLTIPTFSVRCGLLNQSLYIGPYSNGVAGITGVVDYTTAFTIEAWIKCFSATTGTYRTVGSFGNPLTNTDYINLELDGAYLRVKLLKGGITYTRTATNTIPQFDWVHICATYDNINVRLYVNGQLDSTLALAGPLDAGGLTHKVCSNFDVTATPYGGNIAILIFRNATLTNDQVAYQYNRIRNSIVGDSIDDEITAYYTFFGIAKEATQGNLDLLTVPIYEYQENFFELGYGGSFIPIKFDIVADREHSLKFPVNGPIERNFGLQVSWLDDDDNLQRRRLLDPTIKPLDVNPLPEEYNGEVLPVNYTLEIWKLNGYQSVDLTSEITLNTSILSNPQTSTDHAQTVLATPTQRTALYEPFPLTGFPLAFDNAPTDWL